MYIPEHYKLTKIDIIKDFIVLNGFATFTSGGGEYPSITHIPMELEKDADGNDVLRGHFAKANPHWKNLKKNPNATAVFLSEFNHYISSSYYDYDEAPTWNYISIHISGPVRIMDFDETVDSIRQLTKRYERGMKEPVDFDSLPKHVLKQLRGVTGLEMAIENIEAVFKLSQNQTEANFDSIREELIATKDPKSIRMAEAMLKFKDAI